MEELIKIDIVNGKPCVTSLQVAEAFGKEHKNVMRDIRETIAKCSESFTALNFELSEYPTARAENSPCICSPKTD
nr:MAG TPA: regulatory protein [Caudoviricetes sp.]